jgi:hypothetical protein
MKQDVLSRFLDTVTTTTDDVTLMEALDRYEDMVAMMSSDEDRQRQQWEIDLDRERRLSAEIRSMPRFPRGDPDWPGLTSKDRNTALRWWRSGHEAARTRKILERNDLQITRIKRALDAAREHSLGTARLEKRLALLEMDQRDRAARLAELESLVESLPDALSEAGRTVVLESDLNRTPALDDIRILEQRIRTLEEQLLAGDLNQRDDRAVRAEIDRARSRITSILSDPVMLESPERMVVVERPAQPLLLRSGDRIRLAQDMTGTQYVVDDTAEGRLHLKDPEGRPRYVERSGLYPAVVRLETVPYHEMLSERFERDADGAWWVRGMVGDDEARVSNPNVLSDLSGFFGGDSGVEAQADVALAASAHPEDRMDALVDAWVNARIEGDAKRMRKIEAVLDAQRVLSGVPGEHVLRQDGSLDVPPVIPNILRTLTDNEVRALYRGARDYLTIPLRDVFRLAWEIRSRGLRLVEGEL